MASYQAAQMPTKFGKPRYCEQHGKNLMMSCDTCNGELVCAKCISTSHKGHEMSDIEDVAAEKQQSVQQTLQSLRKMYEELDNTNKNIVKMKQESSTISKATVSEIHKRKDELKTRLEEIALEHENVCTKKKKENEDLLIAKEEEILEIQEKIQLCIKKCEDACGSDSGWDIIDLNIDQETGSLPTNCNVQPPTIQHYELVSKQNDSHQSILENSFGELKLPYEIQSNINDKECPESAKKSTVTVSFQEIRQLKMSREVIASICPVASNDVVWVRQWKDNTSPDEIKLVSAEGQILVNVKLDHEIKDITLSTDGSVIACFGDRSIRRILRDGSWKMLFNTKTSTTGICEMPNEDIVVCLRGKGEIAKYSKTGLLLESLGIAGIGSCSTIRNYLKSPHRVCVDQTTGKLAFVDKGPPQLLLITNIDLELKYIFNGSTTFRPGLRVSAMGTNSKFVFNDACFNHHGNIIYTACDDSQMGYIAMLSPEGEFLTRIRDFAGTRVPMAIACDSNGQIWIGDNAGTIVVLKL